MVDGQPTATSDGDALYLRHLRIQHLKLIRDLDLSFTRADGSPRMWTVIIGENGTGKTSILQAIAMAAAGSLQVNALAGGVVGQLRDRRGAEEMKIEAEFGFSDLALRNGSVFPGNVPELTPGLRLRSEVSLKPKQTTLRAMARYEYEGAGLSAPKDDPLDAVRAENTKFWFVSGYGVRRVLPESGRMPRLEQPSIERMATLFNPEASLTSTAFASYFTGKKARLFGKILKSALFKTKQLLPMVNGLELGGRGGIRKAGDLQERDRFQQQVGQSELKVAATSLSHGYQSTIAWIADLVGHIVLEAETDLEPDEMVGLVLIDELDLYLHPLWQVILVKALRDTFKRVQFVATSHSPLVLADLRPDADEIVKLTFDPDSGDVVRDDVRADPRLLTGTELLRQFFGLTNLHPDEAGQELQEYLYLAGNPFRTREDDGKLVALAESLREKGVEPHYAPVKRRASSPKTR